MPLFGPISSESGSYKDEIGKMIQGSAGMPIRYRRHKWRWWDFVRVVRVLWFVHDTSPKPVFEVAMWECRPVPDIDAELQHRLWSSAVLAKVLGMSRPT